MNIRGSGGSISFAKKTKMKDEKPSGQPLEVDTNQMRAIIEADALTTTQEVAKELNIDRSTVIWHLKHFLQR